MKWGSAAEFFAMGGYGLYVWGSYAAVVALMLTEAVLTRSRFRRALDGVASDNQGQELPR